MLKRNVLLTLAATLCSITLFAQGIKMPAASPHQILTQDFALSHITIDYSRPGVKDRTVFGDLVPYGKEWRTGANAVTTIEFGQDVKLEGHDVKAGKYALYTIPNPDEWTIILNKDVKNWGTQYTQGDDVLRFNVPAFEVPVYIETFTINIDSIRNNSAVIYMIWEHTYVPIHVTADIDGTIMSQIEEGMESDKKPYVAAANYYLQTDRDLNKALSWTDAALKENPKSFPVYFLKARIQAKMNDKPGAIATAKEGIEAAKAAKNDEYVGFNEKLISSLQ